MNSDVDPAKADVSDFDNAQRQKASWEKELASPDVQMLKKQALEFIDQWRLKVIQRIGSVVNSRERAETQLASEEAPKSSGQTSISRKINADTAEDPEKSVPPDEDLLSTNFPPVPTPLVAMERDKRILILHSTLLLMLSLEHYLAFSRVLLLYLTSSLKLDLEILTTDEEKVAKGLLEAAKKMSADEEAQKRAEDSKSSRKWKVGLASVAGAAVIGITGGLAAPLVAAGVGSVMGGLGLGATAAAGYLGSVAGSTMIVGGLFGAYGGRMTGQMMDRYSREVEDFAFLPVAEGLKEIDQEARQTTKRENEPRPAPESESQSKSTRPPKLGPRTNSNASPATTTPKGPDYRPPKLPPKQAPAPKQLGGREISGSEASAVEDASARRLRVTIGISGWLTSKPEVITPWRILGPGSEAFALRWELEALLNLGHSMTAMMSSAAWGYAKSEIISRTVFAQLASAAAWPMSLIQIGRVIDNPFSIARKRADKAGEVLADALINKAQGERPVTLVGYSLGARVIYSCLKSLAARRACGLVESAVLIGAPTPSTTSDWRILRTVVASRLVNVFNANDYVLGFMYRSTAVQYGVAGLQKIQGLPAVENVDVSETVSGHLRYRHMIGAILAQIGFEDLDKAAVREEAVILKKMDEEERQKKVQDQAREAGRQIIYGEDGKIIGDKGTGKDGKAEDKKDKQSEEETAEEEAKKMEEEVKEKTTMGMLAGYTPSLPGRMPNLTDVQGVKESLPYVGGKTKEVGENSDSRD